MAGESQWCRNSNSYRYRNSRGNGAARATFHALLPPEPVQLKDIAYLVYRRFTGWLRRQGLLRSSRDNPHHAR
jgi:hypothetical protein